VTFAGTLGGSVIIKESWPSATEPLVSVEVLLLPDVNTIEEFGDEVIVVVSVSELEDEEDPLFPVCVVVEYNVLAEELLETVCLSPRSGREITARSTKNTATAPTATKVSGFNSFFLFPLFEGGQHTNKNCELHLGI